jgi:hypothetical protein
VMGERDRMVRRKWGRCEVCIGIHVDRVRLVLGSVTSVALGCRVPC